MGHLGRCAEFTAGTTDVPERSAAFSETCRCLPFSMAVPAIKPNEPVAWRS